MYYLDFDLLFDYKKKSQKEFIEKISSLIKDKNKNLFVMDGYLLDKTCPTINYLEKKLKININLCLCFAAPHLIQRRQKKKAKNPTFPPIDTIDTIKKTIESLFIRITSFNNNSIFVDTTQKIPKIINQKLFPQRWQELIFLSTLKKAQHDKCYQDIELPSGINVKGYSKSIQTWQRLKTLIDFQNKDVLDMGCFHGFFCFKIEKMEAKKIVGIDKSESAINIVRQIAFLKKSTALFLSGNMENFQVEHPYDIILVLNMLHYAQDIDLALGNIFKSGKTIVFEILVQQEKSILKNALKYNFKLKEKINSHREEREIIIFEKERESNIIQKNIPTKYKFSQKKYKRQKLIKTIKSARALYPLRYIVMAYRKHCGLR